MTSIMTDISNLAVLALMVLVSSKLAWLLTEKWGPLFQFRPFTCEACMSFWLTFVTVLAITWGDYPMAGALGLMNYYRTLIKFNINE